MSRHWAERLRPPWSTHIRDTFYMGLPSIVRAHWVVYAPFLPRRFNHTHGDVVSQLR